MINSKSRAIEQQLETIERQLEAIQQLLRKEDNLWTINEKNEFGNHDGLRKEKQELRKEKLELLNMKSLLLKQETIQYISPSEIIKDFLGFNMITSVVNYSRPSLSLQDKSTEEIKYIVPFMKFVDREESAKVAFRVLDDYLEWKNNPIGEAEKNIKFITVVGTPGKGKTTFARRFIDLPYNGKYPHIVNNCKDSNRRYRISCCDFDLSRDAETQLSLLTLFEAFKYSVSLGTFRQLFCSFFEKHSNSRISFESTLKAIVETFYFDSSIPIDKRLVIFNLDETNGLLDSEEGKSFLKNLFRILRFAANGAYSILFILSGTHSIELFQQVQISNCKFINVELPLIKLESAKKIILGMTINSKKFQVSHFLEYLLKLCGGVGRYIEVAIIQMSIMGAVKMNDTNIKGFNSIAYEYFLEHLQTSQNIETLLAQSTANVLTHYPTVFTRYAKIIELLSCYALFQWKVHRETMIKDFCVGELEKEGLLFLEPVPDISENYLCIIPFITLYWAITRSNQNIQIPFLKDIKSYFSPDKSENNSLRIMMLKLWGLTQKNNLTVDTNGLCTIMLSELLPLRDQQPDIKIKFRPEFTIMDAPYKIEMNNFQNLKDHTKTIAFLNLKGAKFTDAVIFCEPMIGIQEKQSVLAKKKIMSGLKSTKYSDESFQTERAKFPSDHIFVLISDTIQGDIALGDKDIFIDYNHFIEFAGPLIALRKLYCTNELNPKHKRLKLE